MRSAARPTACPYYAGSRVVTYRTDLFKKAGITKLPATTAEYVADAKKLLAKNPKKGFSPVYIAGTDWYFAMSFVFDYGGGIATQVSGKWKGLLSLAEVDRRPRPRTRTSSSRRRGPARRPTRRIRTRTTCTHRVWPRRWSARAGSAAASGRRTRPTTAQFVMPGHVKGQAIPGFLGGSDLAVPVTSSNKALAADWIKDFTSTSSEKALQAKGNIPNATNLLGSSVNERAAARSWFVPTAKHWVDVENGNILRNMLAQILTGKLSIKQAASSASDNIASVLNQP